MSGKLVCLVKGSGVLILCTPTAIIGEGLHLLNGALLLCWLCELPRDLSSRVLMRYKS